MTAQRRDFGGSNDGRLTLPSPSWRPLSIEKRKDARRGAQRGNSTLMEDLMNTIISSAARRTVMSTLAALVLAATFPQAGMAMTAWRVDAAKANGAGSVTLDIQQAGSASTAPGNFIVIANGNVYRVTGAAANGNGVDPKKAVLIGTKARATNHCGSNCRFGAQGPRMTLSFRAASGAGQQISDMLAEAGPSARQSSR
jgi:hypothetical protein